VGTIDAARGSSIASNTLHAARGGKTGEQGHRQGRLSAGGANPFVQGGGSLVTAESRSALGVARGRGVEVAWTGLGRAALELKDQWLGVVRSGWRGQRRWHRSSSVSDSSNQRVEGGPGTAWGGLELQFARAHDRCCEAS
jgi:hypothetical protein